VDLESSLRERGLLVVPWRQVKELAVDLVLSASYAGAPLSIDAPTLFLSHGYGRTRDLTRQEQARPGDIVGFHRVVHAVPHESAVPFLPAWGEAAVVGDPILDSLINSCSQVTQTREGLGLRAGQRLVVVISTWRGNSLFASRPRLFEQLLSELPCDEYVVAAILHPNIWVGHGRWQTRTWLQSALSGGLRLIPFQEGWRPTLASADLVLGDHSSVTFYADLLGKPVFRAFGGLDELAPGTVLAERVRINTRFLPGDRLRDTLEGLSSPSSASTAELLASSVRHVGQAYERLRDLSYELLRLDPPTVPVRGHRSALPDVEWSDPACHWAVLFPSSGRPFEDPEAGASDNTGQSANGLVLERTAVAPTDAAVPARTGPLSRVMVANLGSALPADAERASVLLVDLPTGRTGFRSADRPEAAEALRKILQEHPGCSCVVAYYGEAILILHAGDQAPEWVAVDGLCSDDERAMTAAALLTLTWRLSPDQRGGFPQFDGKPVPVRCGTTHWRLTVDAPGYRPDPPAFSGPS
jgi:CDP-glycerol:poly(glycerophosphate) glycerophosphotransferase